jgi:hypothetical protein
VFIRHRDLLPENERLRRWREEAGENAERAFALMAQCDAERIKAVRQNQGQTCASYYLLDEVRSASSTERSAADRGSGARISLSQEVSTILPSVKAA